MSLDVGSGARLTRAPAVWAATPTTSCACYSTDPIRCFQPTANACIAGVCHRSHGGESSDRREAVKTCCNRQVLEIVCGSRPALLLHSAPGLTCSRSRPTGLHAIHNCHSHIVLHGERLLQRPGHNERCLRPALQECSPQPLQPSARGGVPAVALPRQRDSAASDQGRDQ